MSLARTATLTTLAMIAFAGNSLLCRLALSHTRIDPASFTTIRLVSGAITLWLVMRAKAGASQDHRGKDSGIKATRGAGSWLSALALFAYAASFSFAYSRLPTGSGALLLFGAVQATMIGHGIWTGERLRRLQLAGMVLACGGLVGLLLPGVSAPSLDAAALMLCSGTAWGIYSLRGRGKGDPVRVTTGNFLRAAPIALVLSVLMMGDVTVDAAGLLYALTSGVLTSAIGYIIWYTALPALKATSAATVQLSVPVIAALGGAALLGEPLTLRLLLASVAILGGIALVIFEHQADGAP
ncbi:DMT family transporter [Polaromonas sp.]|uniref:DMT family transporter n=1 Tax=Polaromonas sp. TaxID=1869339 RepID=UPI0032650C48